MGFLAAQGVLGLLEDVAGALARQPFILLFLIVAAGYALGRVSVKGISLGATASTLLIALAISLGSAQVLGVTYAIPEFAGTVFFNLFMFSIGMKVGPQFVSGLRRDAGKFVLLALLVPLLSVAAMFALRAAFDLAPGMTAGIFAGSNTATPGLGAAQTAYASGAAQLPPGVSIGEAVANMSTAFAFAYCVSLVLFVVAMKLPDLLGRDMPGAAREFEAQLHGGGAPLPGTADAFMGGTPAPVAVRAYAVEEPNTIGQRLDALRRTYPWVSIERILRDGKLLEPLDNLVLQAHDTLALYGPVPRLLSAGAHLGPEVPESLPRELGLQTVDIVVYRDASPGQTLLELSRGVAHGLYLNAMFRGGHAIPFGPDTLVRRGDVLRVTGTEWRLKRLEAEIQGRIVRPSISTDVLTLALGLAVGGLVGMITIPIGAVRITLGAAVGLLLVGIGLSTLRTYNPAFGGPYPEPARQMIEDMGLNVFVAILGINAGAGVIEAIESGALAPIFAGCVLVGIVPAVIGWFVGRRFLRMNAALLLGAVAGARCNSAGMRAAQETTRSTVPAISYPVTFAISNVTITVLTYVFAMLG